MILADTGMFPPLLQYMQFMLDADWYAADAFAKQAGGGFGMVGVVLQASSHENSPIVIQRQRMQYIDSVRKAKRGVEDFGYRLLFLMIFQLSIKR